MSDTSPHARYPIDRPGERILAAALAEFSRAGYSATRMADVARRAGVTPATLALYFDRKEDLFREVIRSTVVETARKAGPPDHDLAAHALDQVGAFAQRFWRTMEHPEQEALLRLSIGELRAFPDLALLHATEVLGRDLRVLERILIAGEARGELRLRDPRAAASVVLAAIILHAVWLAAPDIYAGITGPDRNQAEDAVVGVLSEALGQERG